MSRNLGHTNCRHCPGDVALIEAARPLTVDDVGEHYFREYEGMIVAEADCLGCGAEYLAWIDQRPITGNWGRLYRGWAQSTRDGEPFFDLSYRSTFNDEPGEEDLPKRAYVSPTDAKIAALEADVRRLREVEKAAIDWAVIFAHMMRCGYSTESSERYNAACVELQKRANAGGVSGSPRTDGT